MTKASYIDLHEKGELRDRIDRALALITESCRLCPRQCGTDRMSGKLGFCRTGRNARVASYHAHFGEEAPLVGRHGSGTIFFSSCNLLCAFCQNYDISHITAGVEMDSGQLASVMLDLKRSGCHNINFVTPTHVVPQILEALIPAIEQGLDLPLVYNSGGYDSVGTLRLLDGVFDIYMPDFKFWDAKWSDRYCRAPDYREKATSAIEEMHRQVGDLQIDEDGIAVRGLLVRHLVMPGNVAGTSYVMKYLADQISTKTYVNVMAQYRPCGKAVGDPNIGRPISGAEFRDAVVAANEAGLTRLD